MTNLDISWSSKINMYNIHNTWSWHKLNHTWHTFKKKKLCEKFCGFLLFLSRKLGPKLMYCTVLEYVMSWFFEASMFVKCFLKCRKMLFCGGGVFYGLYTIELILVWLEYGWSIAVILCCLCLKELWKVLFVVILYIKESSTSITCC